MTLLTSLFVKNPRPHYPRPSLDTLLVGRRVVLRVGDPADWRNWRSVREASRDFLTPWEPAWPSQALSYDYFCGQLHRHWREWREGTGYAFQICLKPEETASAEAPVFAGDSSAANDAHADMPARKTTLPFFVRTQRKKTPHPDYHHLPVIGGIALNDVARGIAQKGTLGYWMGRPYAGQGLMTEAADLVCRFAFDTLLLHRLEAACLPHNVPSRQLLSRLRFTQEGQAAAYLKINGTWETHILWGRVAEER